MMRPVPLILVLAVPAVASVVWTVSVAQIEPTGPPPEERGWRVTTVIDGLERPWGMAWLPDGRMLITEKAGRLRLVERGRLVPEPVAGVPPVYAGGQGGLMDVALHPDFARNGYVYLTASTGTPRANRTVLLRGVLRGNRLEDVRELFRVSQDKPGGQHFGSRLVWLPDRTLLMSVGDGGNPPLRLGGELIRNNAQNLRSHLGKVLRLTEDGRPARDNPFANRRDADPAIWSYGHRNIQGMVRDPVTGRVWANEHGARGGDEINLIQRGRNYGWPLVTHSIEYSGQPISSERSRPGMEDPVVVWTPCPAPSGLAIVTSDRYPGWKGNLLSGGLASQDVRRVVLDERGRATLQRRMTIGARVRDVRQGPDGWIYLLTDEGNGRLLRLEVGGGR